MFTPEQIKALEAPLSSANVKKNPRGYDYVESWHAEAEANRIFGFDGWSSIILDSKCVLEKEREMSSGKGWTVTYTAVVRVTVDGVVRDGAGAGHGIDRDLGLAHESALKEAASDAEKRALKTFGNQFGLALYDKTKENVVAPPAPSAAVLIAAKTSIELCQSTAQLKQWKSDNAAMLGELPQEHANEIVKAFNERVEQLKPKAVIA